MGFFDHLFKKESAPESAPLSDEELAQIARKIRAEYTAYAEFFGGKSFDVRKFNERYQRAIERHTDLPTFFAAEVRALEEVKYIAMESYKQGVWVFEEEPIPYEESFEKKVNDMIESFERMIAKYPARTLCDGASDEVERLYGALIEFAGLFSLAFSIMRDANDYAFNTAMRAIEDELSGYTVSHSGRVPSNFGDYQLAVGRDPNGAQRKLLARVGVFFNTKVLPAVVGASNRLTKINAEAIAILPKGFAENAPRIAKTFTGKTNRVVVEGARAYAASIVKDFRLKDFR